MKAFGFLAKETLRALTPTVHVFILMVVKMVAWHARIQRWINRSDRKCASCIV